MLKRIETLTKLCLSGNMYPKVVSVDYDRKDIFLSPVKCSTKRVREYILNQEPIINPESAFAGHFLFDGSVEGDVFHRAGHKNFNEAYALFYNQPLENLLTFEWQHSTANFEKIIKGGILSVKAEIAESKLNHQGDDTATEFLDALDTVCDTIIQWAHKCSKRALEVAEKTENDEYKANLNRLANALLKVPENPAESFYEAVLCVYLCFSFVPDSIGLIDRYLYPYFVNDIKNGVLDKGTAKAYLQELFIMLQANSDPKSDRFYRGGESHFAIGGYTKDLEDGFNELSHLIVESLMELPTNIPQISLRWTKKTPYEVFRYMMDCERKDTAKRIAFVNDETKIKSYTERLGMPFEQALNYTMVGCNEVAFPGAMYMGGSNQNIMRSVANTMHNREDILTAETFEDFYKIYEEELFSDLALILDYEDKFNLIRAKDVNVVSSIFFNGCVANAKSVTQGGVDRACAGLDFIGIANAIDSLVVVKQFVFDERAITMEELVSALKADWKGYEHLRTIIKKKGKFFGNDDDTSNYVSARFATSIYNFLKDKKSAFGYRYVVGNLIGYNEHHKWFGEGTLATPDGRKSGDMLKFGLGQSEGYDREGLSALLNSIAKCDPYYIFNGPTVTNVTLDEQLVKNDENFEKTVKMFETYLKNGGIHFQLTYVSREDMLEAQIVPEDYRHLRVRVSGFSDYFVNLNRALQDDVIARTTQTQTQ